jgi:4a-hydroxytetrahydrobiopterin dehydratase
LPGIPITGIETKHKGTTMIKLKPADFVAILKKGWTRKGKKIIKAYQFASFTDAFGFMAMAALGIEKRDHHPEWTNVYNKVAVELSTHDAGGVTAKDLELAKFLDHIAAKFPKKK